VTATPPSVSAVLPGRTLGIAGLVLAVLVGPAGLVVSIVARILSARAHVPNGLATAGIVVGAITTFFTLGAVWLMAGIMCGESGQACFLVGG
jgi:hypothetical protein